MLQWVCVFDLLPPGVGRVSSKPIAWKTSGLIGPNRCHVMFNEALIRICEIALTYGQVDLDKRRCIERVCDLVELIKSHWDGLEIDLCVVPFDFVLSGCTSFADAVVYPGLTEWAVPEVVQEAAELNLVVPRFWETVEAPSSSVRVQSELGPTS